MDNHHHFHHHFHHNVEVHHVLHDQTEPETVTAPDHVPANLGQVTDDIAQAFADLHHRVSQLPPSDSRHTALRRLEEASKWAFQASNRRRVNLDNLPV